MQWYFGWQGKSIKIYGRSFWSVVIGMYSLLFHLYNTVGPTSIFHVYKLAQLDLLQTTLDTYELDSPYMTLVSELGSKSRHDNMVFW